MKKIIIFIGGFIAGILATLLFAYMVSKTNEIKEDLSGLTIFPKKAECIPSKNEIVVFQVLQPNMALANTGDYSDGIVILLINYDGKNYYDEQKIKIPNQKCLRQIGTYQYITKVDHLDKTVPAVVIE